MINNYSKFGISNKTFLISIDFLESLNNEEISFLISKRSKLNLFIECCLCELIKSCRTLFYKLLIAYMFLFIIITKEFLIGNTIIILLIFPFFIKKEFYIKDIQKEKYFRGN